MNATNISVIPPKESYLNQNVEIVQREGRQTTMSCTLPPTKYNWTSCVFEHYTGSEGQCGLGPGHQSQQCGSFPHSHVHITQDGLCQLVIESVTESHVGGWGCQVTYQV